MRRASGESIPQLLVHGENCLWRCRGHYNELELNVLKLNYVLQELESLNGTLPKVFPGHLLLEFGERKLVRRQQLRPSRTFPVLCILLEMPEAPMGSSRTR